MDGAGGTGSRTPVSHLARFFLGAALVAGAAGFVLLVSDPVLQDLAAITCYWLILAGSWNLLAGFTGQMSFAHVGLAAVGAYLAVLLEFELGVGAGPAIPLAGLLTAAAGLVLGLVSTRVRGIYLALVTFAFGGAFVVWARGADTITGGNRGHTAEFLFSGIDARPFLWVGLALVGGYFVLQSLLLDSRFGLAAMAVRDREEVAEGLGIRTRWVKIGIFTYTAFWAGIAGAFYAGYVGIVAPSIGELLNMALVVAMVVVGGMGSRLGPIFGVILLQVIDYKVRGYGSEYTQLIFGALVLGIMLFARNGIVGALEALATRVRAPRGRWEPVVAEAAGAMGSVESSEVAPDVVSAKHLGRRARQVLAETRRKGRAR
jgi:branched-chain amino acid transport system permease protein